MYDVAIIGSGLAGLQCAYLLSKEGYNVCIVDKNARVGGMIQSFVRNGVVFNTGLNYTESLGEGEVLQRYFKLFGLMDKITLRQLDAEQSDIITFGNTSYSIPQGHQEYTNRLKEYFPSESKGIDSYMNGLKETCNFFPMYRLAGNNSYFPTDNELLTSSASEYIEKHINNKNLRGLLAGTSILYAGEKDVTPLYTHALISYSFIKSSWRVKEGGSGIAKILADGVRKNGGTIMRNALVNRVRLKKGVVFCLELEDGEQVIAKNYISSLHPKILIPMVDEGGFKKVFRNRTLSLKDSIGMFSVYIVLKKNSLKYQNYNHHYYKTNNVWTTDSEDWPQNYMLYTQYSHKTNEYADGLTIIAYMKYSEVEKWSNTFVEQRGDDYIAFKQMKAEKLINLAERSIPDLKNKIACYYTSTPLTYRDYTGSVNGSAYGVIKDYKNPTLSMVDTQTRISNLFFTGQNLNMHGVLGVSITSVLTCSHFLGNDYLYEKLIAD